MQEDLSNISIIYSTLLHSIKCLTLYSVQRVASEGERGWFDIGERDGRDRETWRGRFDMRYNRRRIEGNWIRGRGERET